MNDLKEVELVIIGGGPGGIAAAIEAVKAGVEVMLLDENAKPGGQIYRQLERGFVVEDPKSLGRAYQKGLKLIQKFEAFKKQLIYVNEALVWSHFPQQELCYQRKGVSTSLRYRSLIVATGAYDRPVPLPGWTLPGVLTAGGAQRFVKMQGVLPGENILLAGTGPLQLVLASQILRAGGKVNMILEAGKLSNWIEFMKAAWGQWELLFEGGLYLRDIIGSRVPIFTRHIILEIRGQDRVEEAVIAEIDENWRPIQNTKKSISIDTVCLGYGLVPSTEITRLLNCKHKYDPSLGGWIPIRDENMETSVKGVFAVGDGSGVSGSQVAFEEGRVAGISAAETIRHISSDEARRRKRPATSKLKKLKRFRLFLDDMSFPRQGLFELAADDTVVCRCEEITFGEIRRAIAEGANDINEVKRMTRAGMGRCQGRMCGPAIFEMIRRESQFRDTMPGYWTSRPPFKPLDLGTVAQHQALNKSP